MNALRNESQAMARVRDARADLLVTHPFFGVLSLKLELIEDSSIETACVTPKALRFNPQWVLSLSHAELKGIVAHEVSHLALGHHARQGSRDPGRWNDACDHVVNPMLIAEGFTLPKGVLNDSQYAGKTAEAVYNALGDKQPDPNQQPQPQPQPQPGNGAQSPAQGQGQGKPDPSKAGGQPGNASAPNGPQSPGKGKPQPGAGAGATGSFEPAGPADSDANGESEREWRQNVNEAIRAASSAGKLPAHIRREMEVTTKPKADYKTLLRRFFTDQSRTRSTWSKRNKRFAHTFLPGRMNDGLGTVVIMVDTSGSITPAVLNRFGAEVSAIFADCDPSTVHVIYCDARVNRCDTFEQGEPVKLVACGGGGTKFQPAFDHVDREGWTPACAVYLTDLAGPMPRDPGYPVLWATYGAHGAQGPFGETVAID